MPDPSSDASGELQPLRRRRRGHRPPVGSSPGTLRPGSEAAPTTLSVRAYGARGFRELEAIGIADVRALWKESAVVWINCTGFADIAVLRALAETFGLHRLALEDVVNLQQRAKVEDYEDHTFMVLRMIDPTHAGETEQLGLFVGADFVLTFQERPGDCFDVVRQRLRDAAGQMRSRGSDYLAYALLDAVVDGYFPLLEHIDDRLGGIEERILADADAKEVVADLHWVRRCLLELRRAVWPLREAPSTLVRPEARHFSADVRPYLRDVHDHVVQLLDLLENYREMSSSLLDLHLSTVNHRLNEVMKVLTIIATIFIPLTFVVGIYGMNFDWMPETKVWWAYPVCLAAMAIVAGSMVLWFRRRGWL